MRTLGRKWRQIEKYFRYFTTFQTHNSLPNQTNLHQKKKCYEQFLQILKSFYTVVPWCTYFEHVLLVPEYYEANLFLFALIKIKGSRFPLLLLSKHVIVSNQSSLYQTYQISGNGTEVCQPLIIVFKKSAQKYNFSFILFS